MAAIQKCKTCKYWINSKLDLNNGQCKAPVPMYLAPPTPVFYPITQEAQSCTAYVYINRGF